jgi:hypothetical protein
MEQRAKQRLKVFRVYRDACENKLGQGPCSRRWTAKIVEEKGPDAGDKDMETSAANFSMGHWDTGAR